MVQERCPSSKDEFLKAAGTLEFTCYSLKGVEHEKHPLPESDSERALEVL